MRAKVLTVAKHEGQANEDVARIAGNGVFVLCDGASESYNSRLWAQILANGYAGIGNMTAQWLKDRIAEYDKGINAADLGWAARAAADRGSFATLLAVELGQEHCQICAVGDSVAFLLNDDGIVDTYYYEDAGNFAGTPRLLASIYALNRIRNGSNILDDVFCGTFDLRQVSHILLATDALALWIMERRDNDFASIKQLLAIDGHDFRALAEKERKARRMRVDDTTMIRIHIERLPDMPFPCMPAKCAQQNLPALRRSSEGDLA